MRRRYQKGSLQKVDGAWVARWWEGKRRPAKTLGRVSRMTKSEAEAELATIMTRVNSKRGQPSGEYKFGDLVTATFLPFYLRKWKQSTALTTEDRIERHLVSAFGDRALDSLTRDQLQDFLDQKAEEGFSYSVVAHLRWDLNQILRMAVNEGHIQRNPAELLFIPPEAPRPVRRYMTFDQVRLFFSVLELREKVIGGLAILAGMRPGEIFALTRSRVEEEYADIDQRIYRGQIGSPKSPNSRRWAALGDGLTTWLSRWLELLPDTRPEGWLFPSERVKTPLSKDNSWRRNFLPRLKDVGLEWANFQVMRRTHSSLSQELDVAPQVRADQMGHTVDVNQNKYTKASLEQRRKAVNILEKAVGVQ